MGRCISLFKKDKNGGFFQCHVRFQGGDTTSRKIRGCVLEKNIIRQNQQKQKNTSIFHFLLPDFHRKHRNIADLLAFAAFKSPERRPSEYKSKTPFKPNFCMSGMDWYLGQDGLHSLE